MKPIKTLNCCCCGNQTYGRQWWNRDSGFGLCEKCIESHEEYYDEEEMRLNYGVKGIHYCLEKKD